jgi:hypothetical protein
MPPKLRPLLAAPLAAIALAAIASPAAASPPAAAAREPSAPPIPLIVTADGTHRLAARGSFCWFAENHGLCADSTDPMAFAPRVHFPAGTSPVIRMGFPVEDLVALRRDGSELELTPLGQERRKFAIGLPDAAAGTTFAVYLQADYSLGDGSFAVRFIPRGP